MARGGLPEPRPKPPLRYRISPLDKQLDKLEGELSELQKLWADGKVEDDTYDRMLNILETSRTKLIRKMRVAEGLPADEPLEDIELTSEWGGPLKAKKQASRGWNITLSDKVQGILFFCVVCKVVGSFL